MSPDATVTILGHAALLAGPAAPLGDDRDIGSDLNGSLAGISARTLTGQLDVRPTGMSRWPRLDRYGKALAVACDQAVARQRLADGPATGLYVSSQWSCMETNAAFDRGLIVKGPRRASPLLFPYTLPGSTASETATLLGLRGPYLVMTGGPATATANLIAAADLLSSHLGGGSGSLRLLVASADVLGPSTLRHFADDDAIPGNGEPPLAEAGVALWLGRADDRTPGVRVHLSAALGGGPRDITHVTSLAREALGRAELMPDSLQRIVTATADGRLRDLELSAMADLARGITPLSLVWKTGNCSAPLGLLGVAAALQEEGPSLVLAAEPAAATALVVQPLTPSRPRD